MVEHADQHQLQKNTAPTTAEVKTQFSNQATMNILGPIDKAQRHGSPNFDEELLGKREMPSLSSANGGSEKGKPEASSPTNIPANLNMTNDPEQVAQTQIQEDAPEDEDIL
jgi:hypothetical protein